MLLVKSIDNPFIVLGGKYHNKVFTECFSEFVYRIEVWDNMTIFQITNSMPETPHFVGYLLLGQTSLDPCFSK